MTLKTKLHIDWLSVTFNDDYPLFSDYAHWQTISGPATTLDKSRWRPGRPQYGYTLAYVSDCGTQAMSGTAGMGLHIIYSGQALEKLQAKMGVSAEKLIAHLAANGAKATRIDIALDLIDGTNTVQHFHTWAERGHMKSASRSWRHMSSNDGGGTLYVGSRSSDRMVRIYNKKAERASVFEQVDAKSWVRVEIELKGDRAKNMLKSCADNKIEDVLLSHIADTIDFPLSNDYKAALTMQSAAVEVAVLKRKDTRTRHWLLTTVAKALASEVKDDPDFLSKFVAEVDNFKNMP